MFSGNFLLVCFGLVLCLSIYILEYTCQIPLEIKKQKAAGTSLAVQWLGLCLPMQVVGVQSLVREVGSHMPHGQKNQGIQQEQYCDKFIGDFKNVPHQKNLKKKKISLQ